jgi:hypothetical protein
MFGFIIVNSLLLAIATVDFVKNNPKIDNVVEGTDILP